MRILSIFHSRGRGWLTMCACVGIFVVLASLPLRGLAQAPAASSAEQQPTVEVQQLSETKVEIPLSAAAQTNGGASGHQRQAHGEYARRCSSGGCDPAGDASERETGAQG